VETDGKRTGRIREARRDTELTHPLGEKQLIVARNGYLLHL
jgi:hypothetical protein